MAQKYIYNTIPGQNIYNQENVLYEYQTGGNPLDPLGLHGAKYTFGDSSQNIIKTEKVTTIPAETYTTTVENPIYLNYTQQINYGQPQTIKNDYNNGHLYQHQTEHHQGKEIFYQIAGYPVQNQIKNNQPINQHQIQQNVNQQAYIQRQNIQTIPLINQQQYINQKQNQPKTNPQIQTNNPPNYPIQNNKQKIQPQIIPQTQAQAQAQKSFPNQQYQQQQKVQPQIQPQKKINPPQADIQPNKQQTIFPQTQPQTKTNSQQQIQNNPKAQIIEKNKIQPNINPHHQQYQQYQQIQPQVQGLNPAQIHYQKYIQNQYQNNNQKQNQIKLEYNKNDEHFVNKPIYQVRKQVQIPQTSQNPPKVIQTLDKKKTLIKGTIPLGNNIVNNNSQNVGISKGITHNTNLVSKYNVNQLSEIKEEEIDIKQSGLSKKISKINNSKNEIEKEIPMEEKKPEEAFPEDITDEKSKDNISKKSITESGMSDIDSKLDHLPTIYSIMKGKSEPLPPTKKNKYGK